MKVARTVQARTKALTKRREYVENSDPVVPINDVKKIVSGWDSSIGLFVDFSYSIPLEATSENVLLSTDDGETWQDPYLPLGIWVGSFNGSPKHTVRVAQLEKEKTYQLKVVITGGRNEGESNIITFQV